ncbi:helicase-associated domain-containing protein, partial [Corynebacterium sp. 11254D000AR]
VQVAPPRATVPPPKAFHPSASQLSPAALNAAVDAVRAGRPDEPTAATGPDLDLLQAAVRSGRAVVIGYATKTGAQKSLRATPLTVSGGQVDARTQARTVRIPLSRITSLALD